MPTRFNPPPNWPPPPPGWAPPPGWRPDPAWPAPPQGWQLWVDDSPVQDRMAQGPGQGWSSQDRVSQGPVMQAPVTQGPMTQGPAHDWTSQDRVTQGPGMQGPGMQGPGMQGPGMQGPGMQGPGMQGPGMQGPGFQGPGMQGPGFQGPMMQGQAGQGQTGQGQAIRMPALSPDSRWTVGGGLAVFLGALLPWLSATVTDSSLGLGVGGLGYEINGGARAVSAVFGLILVGLAVVIQTKSARGTFVKPRAYAWSIPLIVLSALGVLGFALFTIAGLHGFTEDDGLGGTARVTFTPSVGLIMLLLGCLAAFIGGIRVQRHATR